MAVVTRPCGIFPCVRNSGSLSRTPQNGWTIKLVYDVLKTQLCTVAVSLTLFNTVRLPREAFRYGAIPYLVVYTFWLLVAGLPTALLQLAMGQLSQQDPVGVWRAVPILRGIGHLKVLTSFTCCVYNIMFVALSLAYLIWIGKGSFPLRDCTRLHMTPHGYENKMNASQCFNSTFLSPFTESPQYLGIMAILIFVLWFFLPILLYRLHKSLRNSVDVLAPIVVVIAIVLCTFLANSENLTSIIMSCEQWTPLSLPYIWLSALVQALLSTHIASGYLISAGSTVYRCSDVRWTSIMVIITNLLSGWLSVFLWESIGGAGVKDTSFIAILVLIYQSSVSEKRTKEWPLLAFGMVFISGIITVLSLLFPIFDKLHRLTGDHWRFFATALSAVGTAMTVAVLARGLEVASILDELIVPILTIFTTALEVVGFVFIYGWYYLTIDIEFLIGSRLPCVWTTGWWTAPFLLLGVTGWWLRALLRSTWGQAQTQWPLVGVFVGILFIMIVMAAIAVAKEEQFNLISKMAAAFRPSRLWGPEEPMARYVWMSKRYANEILSNESPSSDQQNCPYIIPTKGNEKIYAEDWLNGNVQTTYNGFIKTGDLSNDKPMLKDTTSIYATYSIPRSKKKKQDEQKFRSPNICIAKGELGGPLACNCNRHFTLNVPDLRNNEVTTSL